MLSLSCLEPRQNPGSTNALGEGEKGERERELGKVKKRASKEGFGWVGGGELKRL